jgi:hypothetical protein
MAVKTNGSVRNGNPSFSKGHAAVAGAANAGDRGTHFGQPARVPLGVVGDLDLLITRVYTRGLALVSLGVRSAAPAPTIEPVLQP